MNKIIFAALMLLIPVTPLLAAVNDGTPQSEIIYRIHLGRAEDVKLVLDSGISPNLTNDEGIPLLALAATRKDPEGISVMKTLLEAGADIDGRDTQGQTALFHAARVGNTDAVMLLLENNTNYYQVDNNGDIARNIAHREGHTELLTAMDDFVKAQAEKIKQQYVEYNDQLQKRYEDERKIVEAYEAEKRAIEEAEEDEEEYMLQEAREQNAAREAEYRKALMNLQAIEEKKQALILEKRNLPAFTESFKQLAFNTCAFQYWSFCLSMNQTTEIPHDELSDTIDTHYTKINELSAALTADYELDKAYIDKIVERSKKRTFNPLQRMPSKTYRFQNGVGKIADMNKRCNEVAKYWNVDRIPHLDTAPPSNNNGKRKKRSGLFGMPGN